MPRTKPADRLTQLTDAAARVFAAKGFRRAQMADIAHVMGVSAGLLYNYVESKEALFYLVIDRGFGAGRVDMPDTFPLPTPTSGAIAERVLERFRAEAGVPALRAARKRPRADDPAAELTSIVREFYGNVVRVTPLTAILERSALDVPELASVYYGRMRGGYVTRLAHYIESRIAAGQFRPVPYPDVAARLIVETITWFARHRHGDPASEEITDIAAEAATVDFIVNSLVVARQPFMQATESLDTSASAPSEKG